MELGLFNEEMTGALSETVERADGGGGMTLELGLGNVEMTGALLETVE